MVLASLKTKDKKIGYRVFTNELKKTLVSLERECSDFGWGIFLYFDVTLLGDDFFDN